MALNSDSQGFLTGNKVELSGFGGEMDALKDDVRSIRKSLMNRRGRDAVVAPTERKSARFDAAPATAIATPKHRGSELDDSGGRTGRGTAGRVTEAAGEAAKVVVNEESDASVKAFNEIAKPLKRGWTALRGSDSGARQEGWLKRIFNAMRGRKSGGLEAADEPRKGKADAPTEFERARDRTIATRDSTPRERDTQGRFVSSESSRNGGAVTRREGGMMSWLFGGGASGSSPEMSLQAIEAHLKSIDKKTRKQEREGFILGAILTLAKFATALFGYLRERRNEGHLATIAKYTERNYREAYPFYRFVRRKLQSIGEAIEESDHESRGNGGLLSMLVAPLLGALAGIAAKLAGIPLIGPALTGLTRLLGGRFPPVLPRGRMPGGGASPGSATPLPAGARAASRWGRAAEGIRANRVARTGRVLMRNAGRAMRPLGRVLGKVPVLGSLLALGLGVAGSASIEKDDSLTRNQKNAAQGKNWGGVAGGFGGAALGAALGTAIAPGLGTVIGGVLGAVLGEWLGGNLGQMIGERFSAFMAPLTPIFNEIKIWALATWDWIRDGASQFFDGVKGVFDSIGERLGEKWDALIDFVTDGFNTFVGNLKIILNALKDVPILGDAIRAAENAANAVAEAAQAAAERAKVVAGNAVDSAKNAAGKAWTGTVEYLKTKVPKGLQDRVAHERALETAADYRQGNISGLDDAHTRELVASTALTESAGGKLDTVNSAGYLGRYQAGAGWLADAGLIKGGTPAVQAAMKRDGFTNEYKWGQSGGMTRFLSNDSNWNDGKSRAKFLASADMQDLAFKTNSNLAIAQLRKEGVITSRTSQAQIAGLLKARHIAGLGGARAVAAGGTGRRDANGTSARDYYNDLAGPNAHFAGAFATGTAAAAKAPAAPVVASTKAPAPPKAPVTSVIPDAPQVQMPMGSATSKPLVVQMPQADAGQDVKDRGIAHIATGGLSRGG